MGLSSKVFAVGISFFLFLIVFEHFLFKYVERSFRLARVKKITNVVIKTLGLF